ncbi:hypothetical protein CSUI_009220 [Cystoisospora suis]|uniref:Uncharacterized protein n=1 Tax=Cystoisospora suis TaxID=483139 RepID=A0A2C6JIQ0_9APIC|nr:hypothetical protein CSUI_009220 [Cystoisospora suis]
MKTIRLSTKCTQKSWAGSCLLKQGGNLRTPLELPYFGGPGSEFGRQCIWHWEQRRSAQADSWSEAMNVGSAFFAAQFAHISCLPGYRTRRGIPGPVYSPRPSSQFQAAVLQNVQADKREASAGSGNGTLAKLRHSHEKSRR